MIRFHNLENDNRKIIETVGHFSVVEHDKDLSVAPDNAASEYFMSKMDVKRRQVLINFDGKNTAVVQSGAMQWMAGDVNATTGIKGAGDLFGKMLKSTVTKESAVKPEYKGIGTMMLEPTYKYIILEDVGNWGPKGMTIEDGMFLACDGTVKHSVEARSSISSAVAGGEGLFNLNLSGHGVVALESNVPKNELICVELEDDTLKIDGHFAIAWSGGLKFTVERSSKSLLGSAVNGEGLVNVYRGTGRVLLAPVTNSASLFAATHLKKA